MMKIFSKRRLIFIRVIFTFILLLQACAQDGVMTRTPTSSPASTTPAPTQQAGLNQDQIRSLESLEIVDDFPLYVMHHYADYDLSQTAVKVDSNVDRWSTFRADDVMLDSNRGCALFAAFGESQKPIYGRNFDWRYSPALILYTHPERGNESLSMVDLEYLVGDQAGFLLELPIEQRISLLEAPNWPFDGMNDCGLVIGMAAVPSSGEVSPDPKKTNIGSLEIMRLILDHTCTVAEAVDLMEGYNILWEGGPELHYLIADATGKAVLVEYSRGKMILLPNQNAWHLVTNFLLSSTGDKPQGVCQRYDTIAGIMQENSGNLSSEQAMRLLSQVSQDITQWSVVYDARMGEVQVVMGKEYGIPHSFDLDINP